MERSAIQANEVRGRLLERDWHPVVIQPIASIVFLRVMPETVENASQILGFLAVIERDEFE
jgi:hypothetical protein